MVDTNNNYTYLMENGDVYTISKEDGKWVLHMTDSEHPSKFIAKHKFISEMYERIPS